MDDVALYRDLEQQLRASTETGTYFVDRKRKIIFWNKRAEWLTGYPGSWAEGRKCQDDLLEHVDQCGVMLCQRFCPLQATIRNGQYLKKSVYLRHHDGHRLPVRVWVGPRYDNDGTIVGAMQVFTDTTTPAEPLCLHHADLLTGLGNALHLDERLSVRICDWERHGHPFGVLIADVDSLDQRVNRSLGRHIGDETLKMVAKTLANSLRGSDMVARYADDEFVIVLQNASPDALRDAGERLRRLVAASRLPESSHHSEVTISVGGARVVDGDNALTLLKRAGAQLGAAKRDGRDRVRIDPTD
jgi:diguanylate cyclase (GGDEF)-like protein/PAS domain S-box-containing protein